MVQSLFDADEFKNSHVIWNVTKTETKEGSLLPPSLSPLLDAPTLPVLALSVLPSPGCHLSPLVLLLPSWHPQTQLCYRETVLDPKPGIPLHCHCCNPPVKGSELDHFLKKTPILGLSTVNDIHKYNIIIVVVLANGILFHCYHELKIKSLPGGTFHSIVEEMENNTTH